MRYLAARLVRDGLPRPRLAERICGTCPAQSVERVRADPGRAAGRDPSIKPRARLAKRMYTTFPVQTFGRVRTDPGRATGLDLPISRFRFRVSGKCGTWPRDWCVTGFRVPGLSRERIVRTLHPRTVAGLSIYPVAGMSIYSVAVLSIYSGAELSIHILFDCRAVHLLFIRLQTWPRDWCVTGFRVPGLQSVNDRSKDSSPYWWHSDRMSST